MKLLTHSRLFGVLLIAASMPMDPGVALVARSDGLWRSRDSAGVFEQMNDQPSSTLLISTIMPGAVIAGTDSGVLYSFDQGITWDDVDDAIVDPPTRLLVADRAPVVVRWFDNAVLGRGSANEETRAAAARHAPSWPHAPRWHSAPAPSSRCATTGSATRVWRWARRPYGRGPGSPEGLDSGISRP